MFESLSRPTELYIVEEKFHFINKGPGFPGYIGKLLMYIIHTKFELV